MSADDQSSPNVPNQDGALSTDPDAVFSIDSAFENRRPVFVQDLPKRMTVLASYPIGSGDRELRVSTHKIKGRARVDLRFWTRDGNIFIAEHEGINVEAGNLGTFQAMLNRAAKKLGVK